MVKEGKAPTNCKLLEENSFRGRTTDFFYMLFFGAAVLTGIVLVGGMLPYLSKTFAKIIFLINFLTYMMVYGMEQTKSLYPPELSRFIYIHSSLLTLVPYDFLGQSAYLYDSLFVGFSVLNGKQGMIAGHAYYFLKDVYPRITGGRPLRTPSFIKALFAEDAVVVARPENLRFAPPPVEDVR